MLKKILFIFSILLLSQVCFAGRVQQAHKAVIAAKNGATPAGCSEGSGHIILGSTSSDLTYAYNANYVHYSLYTADHSCTIDRLVQKLSNSGSSSFKVRMAIFSVVAGEPSVELSNTTESSTNGNGSPQDVVCTLTTPIEITASTQYWIASWTNNVNTGSIYYESNDGSQGGYQSATYSSSGSFPSPSRTTWIDKPVMQGLSE